MTDMLRRLIDFHRQSRELAATRALLAGVPDDMRALHDEHTAAQAREHFTVARRRDGIELSGFLAGEHGEVLLTALRAVAGVPAADDPRSAGQRSAAALTDLATLVLDQGIAGAGKALVRPHISVLVDWATFARLAAAPDERQEEAGVALLRATKVTGQLHTIDAGRGIGTA